MTLNMNSNPLNGKRVLIFQQRGWGKGIGRFLARKLYQEGAKLAALTFKDSTHELIINQPDVKYEHIIFGDGIMENPKGYLAGETYSLEEITKELGVDSIWPLVSCMRLYVRSYADKYYYGFKKNVSDERIIDYVMAIYKNIRFFFNTFNPDVIICPTFVSLPHIMFNLYGLKRNVPMIALTDSKVHGYYIFVSGYQYDRGQFFIRLDDLNSKKAETPNRKKAETYIQEFRDKFKLPEDAELLMKTEKETLFKKIRSELSLYKQIMRWYIKKPKDILKLGPTYEYRPPKILWRDHRCERKYRKFMDTYAYYPFEKVKKYVYFPLQFQPEEAIDIRAPYFTNQIETARIAAMSLPSDYTLVVKEHPAMVGKRPPSYIEKVARTVNVKLIDYRTPSEKVLAGAALVISPSGTTIAEATFLKKPIPVIQLGELGTTLALPNVTHHTDMTTLSAKIKEVLAKNLQTPEYERLLQNFVAAVLDTGFDYNYIKAWERGGEDLNVLWHIYKTELERIFNLTKKQNL